jgi:anti-sigma B factor antagonist
MLDFNVSHSDPVTLIEASGRIDSSNANQLGEALTGVIDEGHTQLVLDLSGVGYMSSAGLREIVSALKKLRRVSGDLRIAQPSPRVVEVIEMSGLDSEIQVFASQAEAINSY